MDAAHRLRRRARARLQPLNPDWDHALPRADRHQPARRGRRLVEPLDRRTRRGNSAHEIRTWVAAFAALAAQGRYETGSPVLPGGARADRRLRHQDGGADDAAVSRSRRSGFDHTVDVLVVGSGGGGMTAALAADAAGLDTLVVEKSPQFGGSTALSGGGIWVPGRTVAAQGGLRARPRRRVRVPAADHRRPGQRRAAAPVRRRRAGDDGVPREAQSVVRIRLEARLCRLLPGAARRLRTGQHHQRARDRPAQARRRGAEPAAAAGVGARRESGSPPRIFGCSTRCARTGGARPCW